MTLTSCARVSLSLLVRVIFIAHSVFIVGFTAQSSTKWLWFLSLVDVCILVELVYVMQVTKGESRKWFCPSAFMYTVSVIPALWFLELERIRRHSNLADNINYSANKSVNNSVNNSTLSQNGTSLEVHKTEMDAHKPTDEEIEMLEQSVLLVLILTRWIMPKGRITRDELSQMLFVYVAVGSDLMELLLLFNEPTVVSSSALNFVILTTWSLSLLQFSLVFNNSRTARVSRVENMSGDQSTQRLTVTRNREICSGNLGEILGLLSTLCLMDAPFLAVRMYVVLKLRVVNYSILFFVVKNCIVIFLTFYRFITFCLRD